MKITKKKIIQLTKATFSRGYIEQQDESDFVRLVIGASIGADSQDYDYSNWHVNDLKDLADAIYAFIKDMKE